MKLALFALSGLLAAATLVKADVPALINYQGFVTDGNGNPIGATAPENRKIVFRIYNDADAGDLLWTEEHTVTLVNGQFSILLGAGIEATGTAAGEIHPAIDSIFFKDGERYVGLTVDNGDNTINASDTEIAPRQRITSTAYALRAKTADRVDSDSSLLFTGDTNHGVGWFGSGRPFAGLDVNGPVLYGYNGGALGSVQGSTESTALRWESDGDVTVSKDLAAVGLAASGNVTIAGTTTLSSVLRMKGNPIYLHGNTEDANHGLIYKSNYATKSVDGPVLFGFSGGALGISGSGELRALQWSPDGGAAKVFVNGKLGVGVEAPSKALEVNGAMSATGNIDSGGSLSTTTGATLGGNVTVGGTLSVTGETTFNGGVETRGRLFANEGITFGGSSPDGNYVGTPGNYISFGHDNVSEDFIGYKENTFYFRDSLNGQDTAHPDVKIGDKSVAVGEQPLKIIRGTIKYDGTVLAGSGFTVSRKSWPHRDSDNSVSVGHFYITFAEEFSSNPTVTASPYNAGAQEGVIVFDWDVDDADGDEQHFHGNYSSEHDPKQGIAIVSRNVSNGNETNHGITFIAIGPR